MIQLTRTNLEINFTSKKYNIKKSYQDLLKRNDIGFFKLPDRHHIWEESLKKGQNIKDNFEKLVVIGIGGSSLGPLTLLRSLAPDSNVEVWDTVDPVEVDRLWQGLSNLAKVHFLAISKSGNTMETLGLVNYIGAKLKLQNLNISSQFSVVTTFNQNPLHNWAIKNGIEATDFPKDVGGRFSVLTSVGLIPAAFAGINLEELRLGAKWTLENPELTLKLSSLVLESFEQEKWITVFWLYPDALSLFGDWIRQLWAESIGKAHDRKNQTAPRASTPFICLGTKDQHSVLQQIGEGYKDKFVWFFKSKNTENHKNISSILNLFPEASFLNNNGLNSLIKTEAQATQDALITNGVPTLTLETQNITAKEIGAYFMLFELIIGVIGEALDINAFDQPGVELGKKLAIKELSQNH